MKSYGDYRARVSMNILLVMISHPILSYGVRSTSAQMFYPGIIVGFHCNVPNPNIQVNDIERTSERGIDGYIEDLSAVGIEAKGVSKGGSFISTVCVNGSSANLTQFDTLTITITCQEVQFDPSFQQLPQVIPHFIFTLTYQGRLPAPEYVRMNDNNMLVWGRPPCVTNSSSNTYSIEVFHTLELTYTIYFTHVSNGATVIDITVSTTFYDLSLATMLEPCSEYHIEVFAHNTEIELVGERRNLTLPYTHRMQGCSPVTSSSDSEVVDTTIPTPINREDKTKQTNNPIEIVAGAIVGVVVVLLVIIVAIIFIVYWFSKRNRKQNAVKNVPINVEDFIAEDNMYMYAESNSPPTYEQSKQPDRPVAGEEQQINGVYCTVNVQTTQPTHIASVNPSINGNTKRQPQIKKQDKDQQSPKRDLIYTDVAVTETAGWIAPPAADAQTYVTVQTKPHTD